jgi:hypothetical protein
MRRLDDVATKIPDRFDSGRGRFMFGLDSRPECAVPTRHAAQSADSTCGETARRWDSRTANHCIHRAVHADTSCNCKCAFLVFHDTVLRSFPIS